ncbi:MAG: hypothetical protein AAF628_04010 [Planctomycetota bacterium]
MIQDAAPHPQQATLEFFGPIVLAYLVVCAAWLSAYQLRPQWWDRQPEGASTRPWLDLGLALLGAVGVLAMGEAYRQGWRIPDGSGGWRHVTFNLNVLLWYAPIGIVLLSRRQSLGTVWLSARRLGIKLAVGAALSLLGLAVYLGLRGELDRFAAVLLDCGSAHSLAHALPVFLEAVAVAFLVVRLRWALGLKVGLIVPCLLFALAHVPRGIDGGQPVDVIAKFFALNSLLPLAIFATVARSRDVVWIGVVHYVLDVAIEAFR